MPEVGWRSHSSSARRRCPSATGRWLRKLRRVTVRTMIRRTGGETLVPWSVFWAAEMMTTASARPASGESGLVVNTAIRAPALAAVSAALTTLEVVPGPEATRGAGHRWRWRAWWSHRRGGRSGPGASVSWQCAQDQAVAARSGNKYPTGMAKVSCEIRYLLLVASCRRGCNLLSDKRQIPDDVASVAVRIPRSVCCQTHHLSPWLEHSASTWVQLGWHPCS